MLDPHADREGLALHLHAARFERPVQVVCGEAGRDHHRIKPQGFPDGRIVRNGLDLHSRASSVLKNQIDDLGLKPEDATGLFAMHAEFVDDELQLVGTDVRMMQVLDGRVGAAGHEFVQEGVGIGVARARRKFAVAESARTAESEKNVGFDVEHVLLDMPADVAEAFHHALAHFENSDRIPLAGQSKRGREAGGAATDDGDVFARQGVTPSGILRARSIGFDVGNAWVLHGARARELDGVTPQGTVACTGIKRFAYDPQVGYRIRGQIEIFCDRLGQSFRFRPDRIYGHRDFADEVAGRRGHGRCKSR